MTNHSVSTLQSSAPIPHPIEGVWAAVRLEFAGEAAPEMMLEKTEVVFRDGNYSVRFGGEKSFHGKYSITETALHIEGRLLAEKKSVTIRGIYQLVGNRLRICLGMDGVSPVEFVSKSGTQHYLGTYRRVS